MKKFLSILLAGIMLACMIPTMAFAEDAPSGIFVGETQYSSIDAAAAAAYNTTSKEITISGTVAVNGRQTIAYDGVKLIGINNATLIPSASYANGSATNRKALFTITASNVIVNNVSFDGSVYGDTLTGTDDFVVVRVNSGTGIQLNNVYITGSKKSLMQIGTSSSSASVTATNISGQATYKALPINSILSGTVYPDIDINSGSSLAIVSGAINAFIKAESGATFTYPSSTYYGFTYTHNWISYTIYSTARHIVNSYLYAKEHDDVDATKLENLFSNSNNMNTVGSMVTNTLAESPRDLTFIQQLKELIDAAINKLSSGNTYRATLEGYSTRLGEALTQSN